MKHITQFSIAFLAALTLSACGIQNKENTSQEINQKQEPIVVTSTEDNIKRTTGQEPLFSPLFAAFHVGKLLDEPIKFPTISRKIDHVSIKAYKVKRESFVSLLSQHSGWAAHEEKLNLTMLDAKEKKPFFEGTLKIQETSILTNTPRESTISGPPSGTEMNGYIEIPLTQLDGTWSDQGYYYFEFETPKLSGGDFFHSLLEVTETRASVDYEDQYVN